MIKASRASIQPPGSKSKPTVPANSTKAGEELGFDFVGFQAHVLHKSPKTNGKKWKLIAGGNGPHSFTRKQYDGLKFWARNSSQALVNKASPAANLLSMHFENQPKLLAACEAIENGKLKDTTVLHGHLQVLANAQNKWAAKQPLDEASGELTQAQAALQAFNDQLLSEQQRMRAVADQRLDQMSQAREQALAAKGTLRTKKEERVAARSRAMADSLVRKVTDAALPIPAQKNEKPLDGRTKGKAKTGLLQKTKAALLQRPKDTQTQAIPKEQKARMAQLTQSVQQRQPVGPVNRKALSQEIRTRAEAARVSTQEHIEHLLIDLPVGGYLPQDVFDALRELHAAETAESEKVYVAQANEQLQIAQQTVAQLQSRYNEAKTAYDAVPMPG